MSCDSYYRKIAFERDLVYGTLSFFLHWLLLLMIRIPYDLLYQNPTNYGIVMHTHLYIYICIEMYVCIYTCMQGHAGFISSTVASKSPLVLSRVEPHVVARVSSSTVLMFLSAASPCLTFKRRESIASGLA